MESTYLITLIFSNCIAVISQQYSVVPSCVSVIILVQTVISVECNCWTNTSFMERHLKMFERNGIED